MTPELTERWKSAKAPFNGITVATCDEPGPDILQEMLHFCMEALSPKYQTILLNHDWHEHDGFVNDAELFDWKHFSQITESIESLIASRNNEPEVRIAIFPASFEWLLRYNLDDDDEMWCDFDFSADPSSSAADLVGRISAKWPGYTDNSNSKEFFDHSFGG